MDHLPARWRAAGERPRARRAMASRATVGVAGALLAAALANQLAAKRSERRNPPRGRFLTLEGVRLHYLEQGQGPAVVLIHGNGIDSQDYVLSGLFEKLAEGHRVIAFDRPGFGYSE